MPVIPPLPKTRVTEATPFSRTGLDDLGPLSINRKLLTYNQVETIFKEVEETVNVRPLVYVSDDINSSITLPPAHFLTLNPNIEIPELEYSKNDADYNPYESTSEKLLNVWKKGQKLLNTFWRTWQDEYLLSLRERSQRKKNRHVQSQFLINIGDVVTIKKDVPRGSWKLGKVVHLVSSFDGRVRSAKVLLSSGRTWCRLLNLLYPVEVNACETSYSGHDENLHTCPLNKPKSFQRPVRAAASVTKSE